MRRVDRLDVPSERPPGGTSDRRVPGPGPSLAESGGGRARPVDRAVGVLLLTPAEAARVLRVRESWLRRAAAQRRVPCSFVSKHLRFSWADLDVIAGADVRPARDAAACLTPRQTRCVWRGGPHTACSSACIARSWTPPTSHCGIACCERGLCCAMDRTTWFAVQNSLPAHRWDADVGNRVYHPIKPNCGSRSWPRSRRSVCSSTRDWPKPSSETG